MPKTRKKFVQVGLGGRARMFYNAVTGDYKDSSELKAFCDVNPIRMEYANKVIQEENGYKPVKTYSPDKFDEMIKKEKPDVVIVTSIDRTHHRYICRAMELGCDVITEKPMTVDEKKCQQILDTVKKTGKNVRVTFNYRYAPHSTKLRELVMEDAIGQIFSVHFEWLLDIRHGADYFRRWHRDKRNSGGLLVHKSTHHFDLVNFWLGAQPKTVFAMGDLRFYGRENAEERGETKFYYRATGNKNAEKDPFAINLQDNSNLEELYYKAEKHDGYLRDQSVFGDGISIEDTMAVMVKYNTGAFLTYSLNAYMPWEGFRIALNGSKGRIEMAIGEKTYINAGGEITDEGASRYRQLRVFPMHDKPYEVDIPEGKGGHGGGDVVLLNDLFGKPVKDKFNRAANHVDGAMSILTGVAGNVSMRTGLPVQVDNLVKF